MPGTQRIATALALVAAALVAPSTALAEDCHYCGECKETQYKLCLVRVYQRAELPVYQCQTQTVFCPDRGIVQHCRRCDNFLRMEKCGQTPMPVVVEPCNCGDTCQSGCQSHGHAQGHGCSTHLSDHSCPPPTWAGHIYYNREYCPKESCPEGACPTGTHNCATVALPTDETCEVLVPVLKWVRVPVCNGCCDRH